MVGMPTLWKTKIIKKYNFDPKFTAGSDDTDLSYRISNKGYIFGHSSAIIYNIHRTTLKQYIKNIYGMEKVMRNLLQIILKDH